MELSFVQQGTKELLLIDDARITHKNFSGAAGTYNKEGERNFSLVIPTVEMKDQLVARGWNVRVKPPKEEGDTPFMYLPVKVGFNQYGPDVYLVSGSARIKLDAESVGCLDRVDIISVRMDIRPNDWTMPGGRSGRSAWLQGMEVTQRVSRFSPDYAE